MNKSRQIGFSTVIAGEGFAKSLARKAYKANYVSINQTEAADKIDIARNFYHSIPDEFGQGDDPIKPVLWTDAEHEISFHRPPEVSTLISQPASSAIRGGRKDIYFDEFAHIRDATKLYKAAIPATTRGNSTLTIISTPLGQSGLFYDIATDTVSYPQYSRHAVPWWESKAMVRDGYMEEALALAPTMSTVERVSRFGTLKLQAILDGFGGDVQGFATEYEATFVDETEAYYPWDLIVRGSDADQKIWRDIPNGWEPEGMVTLGVDLARDRDESVYTVVDHIEVGDERIAKVMLIRTSQAPYMEQAEMLTSLIKRSKASRVSIDATGPGAMFVEQIRKTGAGQLVEGVTFTASKKERWATKFKGELQKGTVRFPRHQDLMRQIHGIRRTKSEAGLYKFSGGTGAKRDDHFWSLMLALYGEGRRPIRISTL